MKQGSIFRSLLLGLFAGPILAWALATAFYYYPMQQAALLRGEVEDFAGWPIALIGGAGALLGSIVALTIGNRPLPLSVKHATIGALVSVGLVVLGILILAQMFGGPSSKRQAPYLDWGRIYAVPVALVAVEWTWDGNDEMDPAQGGGWAVVMGDELHETILFHGGDDSRVRGEEGWSEVKNGETLMAGYSDANTSFKSN
jgi:hypothetical protein